MGFVSGQTNCFVNMQPSSSENRRNPSRTGLQGLLRAHRITLNCGREVGKNKIPKVGRAMLELL